MHLFPHFVVLKNYAVFRRRFSKYLTYNIVQRSAIVFNKLSPQTFSKFITDPANTMIQRGLKLKHKRDSSMIIYDIKYSYNTFIRHITDVTKHLYFEGHINCKS